MTTTRIILSLFSVPAAVLAQSTPAPTTPSEAAGNSPTMSAPAASAEEAAREIAATQQELVAITQQIGDIQTRAEAADEVKASREKYHGAVREEMVKAAPTMEKDIDRQMELVKELTAVTSTDGQSDASTVPLEERQKLVDEYRTLQDKIAPIEKGVREVPVVQESRKEYYDALMAEMNRLEPKTEALLSKRRELAIRMQQLTTQGRSG